MAKENEDVFMLSAEEKEELLKIARTTIANVVIGRKLQPPEAKFPVFLVNRGVFVTLHKKGELRGCIGLVEPEKPLLEAVVEMAEAAALHDPRFKPVRIDDVPDLDIEISVLSPLQQVTELEEIEVGTHGLMVERGYFSGLLLPQVAVENEWNRTAFLQHACLKAGLPMDAWHDTELEIYIFTTEVFGESKDESMIVE
ncbi:AmmeMemoRadiSam system protein A [candidate division KSB1 bacterium]|nr:AmmeMemoRadiSam system protein A [candidate division KSB1 bacterium]